VYSILSFMAILFYSQGISRASTTLPTISSFPSQIPHIHTTQCSKRSYCGRVCSGIHNPISSTATGCGDVIRSFQIATAMLSLCNLLVHTPPIEEFVPFQAPSWWVSTSNHQDHHRKSMKSHYSSPTFNIETLLCACKRRAPNHK